MADQPHNRLPAALTRMGRFFLATTRDYLLIVRGGSEGAGFKALGQITRGGPLNWLGLAALMCCIIATAYLLLQRQAPPLASAELWDGQRAR